MIVQLFRFQVIGSDYWKALAQGQQKFYTEKQGERGEIYLSGKNDETYPLAVNREWEYVYLVPSEIQNREEDVEKMIKTLSEILEIEGSFIAQRISKEKSLFEKIKSRLKPEEVEQLKLLSFPGVYIGKEDIRYYPQDNLASHLIGFLGGENQGQYGVEGYFNDVLKGTSVFQEGEVLSRGALLIGKSFDNPKKGKDIQLTIDYNIQFMAEKMLEEAKEGLDIEGGTILVGDPHTGKILAMANFPDFNPNFYSQEDNLKIFQNQAIQSIFEPGSIFKSITMAIALEEGKITPQTKYVDTGNVQIGGRTVRNFARRIWGEQNMTEVLEKSINTGVVYAQKLVGNEVFTDYLEKFELFKPTGIELQGEVASQNLSFKKGYEINYANASFGQGIELTSIQILKAFFALANGGRIVDPYITENKNNVSSPRRIISPGTSSTITSMMISVVENGFAKTAQVPGYYVAGKTGTAQVPWSSLGINKIGYSDKTIQGFIGYAPAMSPAFVILVKLDNPKARTAEYSAAPIFGELAKYILDYYQIPPDRAE